jgi:hypothetical protein
MNRHGGARKGSGRKTKTGRKPITIYIKEEIIRALEPGARTKLRHLIEARPRDQLVRDASS